MYYLLFCAVFFLLLSIHEKYRFEWLTVSIMSALLWVNTEVWGHNDPELYFIRAVIVAVAALSLLTSKSRLALYHSLILLLTLIAYGMLAYDVSQQAHVLIYNYYEAVVYGLVACQLIGCYPTVRAGYYYFLTNNAVNMEHGQVGEK